MPYVYRLCCFAVDSSSHFSFLPERRQIHTQTHKVTDAAGDLTDASATAD